MAIISLIEPKIPQNTGSIARMCAANYIPLHLVGKLGFSLEDKYMKRAGLDYWAEVEMSRFKKTAEYIDQLDPSQVYLFSTKGKALYTDIQYNSSPVLLFGSETEGLSQAIRDRFADRIYKIPMPNPNIRSLNLATSTGIVLYEVLRQRRQSPHN